MKRVAMIIAAAAAAVALCQRMDSRIGAQRVDRSCDPTYDARHKLYLYGSGD